jgi:excinuclease ABC subunit C
MIPLFQGKYSFLIKSLTLKMRAAAAHRQYEAAALIRDQISSLRVVAEKQKIVAHQKESYDVVSLARTDEASVVNLFRIRDGVLIARAAFPLRHANADTPHELIYSSDVPHAVYAPLPVPSPLPSRIAVRVPVRGIKRQLLRLGEENAQEELKRFTALHSLTQSKAMEALSLLTALLRLAKLPARIESYDISNIQGRHAVGAMTVLLDGAPAPREYRSFTIKTVEGSNDGAMLGEMLRRRLAHSVQMNNKLKEKGSKSIEKKTIQQFNNVTIHSWPLPDLIIIDGGKPQLAAVQQVLQQYRLTIPLIGIAKGRGLTPRARKERGEEIWSVNARGEFRLIDFRNHTAARHLLDRVRDEAHRFGIGHYRTKHRKGLTATRLDRIPGIGPKTRTTLLKTFGSWNAVQQADPHALVKLIGKKKAATLSSSSAD